MTDCLIDDARRDYFAGGFEYPSVDELKKSGRWEKLDRSRQEWYLRGEQCGKNLSPEIVKKLDDCAARLEKRFGLQSTAY